MHIYYPINLLMGEPDAVVDVWSLRVIAAAFPSYWFSVVGNAFVYLYQNIEPLALLAILDTPGIIVEILQEITDSWMALLRHIMTCYFLKLQLSLWLLPWCMVLLDTPTMNSPNLIISLLLHLPCPQDEAWVGRIVSMVRRPSIIRSGWPPTRGVPTLLFELRHMSC